MEPSNFVPAVLSGADEAQAFIHICCHSFAMSYQMELREKSLPPIWQVPDLPLWEFPRRAAERALCPFLQLEADQMAATKSHSLLQTIPVRRSTSGPGEARTRVTARSHPRVSWNQKLLRGLQASYSYVAKEGLPKTVSLIHCSCWRCPRGSLTTPFFSYTDHFEYGKKC